MEVERRDFQRIAHNNRWRKRFTAFVINLLWGLLRGREYFIFDLCGFAGVEMTGQEFLYVCP